MACRPSHRLNWPHRTLLAASLLLGLPACAAPSSPQYTWESSLLVASAEQSEAPALWAASDGAALAWVSADASGVHQDFRFLGANGAGPVVVLPLPPTQPFAQSLHPAANGKLHLLWLDIAAPGDPRLHSALLTSQGAVERGPVAHASQAVQRYAAAADGRGGLWLVTSEGLAAEPALVARYLDPTGRPRLSDGKRLAQDADWPALTASQGQQLLCWLRASDRAALCAAFHEGQIGEPYPAAPAIPMARGDRLTSFTATADANHLYLFWNITRLDGTAETWFSARALPLLTESSPTRLGIAVKSDPFETGFNAGLAQAAAAGSDWASWAAPLTWALDTLPVAVQVRDTLGVVYFQDGRVAGYQTAAAGIQLIGRLTLAADRDRFLYVAWSQPDEETAHLWLAVNKPLTLKP